MAILKSSPGELAIHGGGPPAFTSRLPVFNPNVGDGQRFGELAERMFKSSETQGRLAEEFEDALSNWIGARNVVGFSSLHAAVRCLAKTLRPGGHVLLPAFGSGVFDIDEEVHYLECEPATYGVSPAAVAENLRENVRAVFAMHPLGRPCLVQEIEDICDEWNLPLFLFGHQALGCYHHKERLGSFGRAEIFELGRDQLIHALDAAVVTTDDDLLAHRLRSFRSNRPEGVDQAMGDAAAAMGIANLESAERFIGQNKSRYEMYCEHLADVPGMKLARHSAGSTYQSISIEVDAGLAGITRDSLFDVLTAENVGTSKPFQGQALISFPVSARLTSSLLQLPCGASGEAIEAVCKLVELAVVRSLESPDPLRLAA